MKLLHEVVQYAYEHAAGFRQRMQNAGIVPGDIQTKSDLAKIPILKKEDLPVLQQASSPFGALATLNTEKMARVFMSPGPIYDPQPEDGDSWRFSEAMKAAGFNENDIVQNTFSYHLSPAGFMFDAALRKVGATVIPAGTGNRELQIQVMKDLKVTGYVGTPSFLSILLDAAEEKGLKFGSDLMISKAFFTAEMLTNEMRRRCEEYGISVYEGYGTADCGCLAFEDKKGPRLKVTSTALVQLCDPQTGEEISDGEGEVVVTLFDKAYPLIRFGTGDLSRWVKGYEGERIEGVLGRVSDGVKVKGMFVREKQIGNILEELGYERYQAIVSREQNQDKLEILIESEEPITEQAFTKIKDVIRVTPIVTTVPSRSLHMEEKCLVDKRVWDKIK
ncbi:AMP-binding protein [Bacillus timonensis]|nr:AMP-binding protein [Bacillus timonensis]